jgi:hypothetical protein
MGITNRLRSYDSTLTALKSMLPTILRCRRNVLTDVLPSNDKRIQRDQPILF